MTTSPSRILVVGAGVAGLTAARALRDAGHDVTVVDKGRAVGGRLATRRVGEARFDHGAQFLTVKRDEVRPIVDGWRDAGLVTTWFHGAPDLDAPDDGDGHPRLRGVPVMRSIAEHLAAGLEVRLGLRVHALTADAGGWVLPATDVDGGDHELTGQAVLVTAPGPQTRDLLAAGEVTLSDAGSRVLAGLTFDPCLAVLAVPAGPTALPHEGALRLADGPVSWLADGLRKGSSPAPAVVVHGAPGISRDLWSASDDEVAAALLPAAAPHLGVDVEVVRVQRWRYAMPNGTTPDGDALLEHAPAPIAFAGDAFAGGRIEGAMVSGRAAAALLTDALS